MEKTYRVFRTLAMAALCVVTPFCTTGAIAQDKLTPEAKKPTVYREKTGTITATVQAIDLGVSLVKKGATGGWAGSGETGMEAMVLDSTTNAVIALGANSRAAAFDERFSK